MLDATIELPALAKERSLDLVLVQEQYPGSADVIEVGTRPKADIYVHGNSVAATTLQHLSNELCVVCHAVIKGTELYLISAYFKYNIDIINHLAHLEGVLDQLRGKPVLICVDSNAHSPL